MQLALKFRTLGNTFHMRQCEGSVSLCRMFSYTFRMVSFDLDVKFNQYGKVPILVCESADPAIARTCVEQLKSVPEQKNWVRRMAICESVETPGGL